MFLSSQTAAYLTEKVSTSNHLVPFCPRESHPHVVLRWYPFGDPSLEIGILKVAKWYHKNYKKNRDEKIVGKGSCNKIMTNIMYHIKLTVTCLSLSNNKRVISQRGNHSIVSTLWKASVKGVKTEGRESKCRKDCADSFTNFTGATCLSLEGFLFLPILSVLDGWKFS